MDDNQAFVVDHGQVAHNDFDDELVVIHFASGCYFSLRDSAAAIWKQLAAAPASPATLSQLFAQPPATATAEINSFLHDLAGRGLLSPSSAVASPPRTGQTAFATPSMEVFDDLQQLLVADVIHDTDAQGWPRIAPDQAA